MAGAGRRGRQGRKVPPTEFQINVDLCIVYMLILRRVHSVSWVSVRICEQGGLVLSPPGQKGRRVAGRRRPSLFSSRPEPRAAREGCSRGGGGGRNGPERRQQVPCDPFQVCSQVPLEIPHAILHPFLCWICCSPRGHHS